MFDGRQRKNTTQRIAIRHRDELINCAHMKRVRIAIIGTGSAVEWTILPTLSSPDVTSPPDSGAWWARRADSPDIHYQAPARPEIVAIAEADASKSSRAPSRVERVAQTARIRGVYADWRAMLREVECEAIVCVAPPHVAAEVVAATGGAKPLWIWGAPAVSLDALNRLQNGLRGRDSKIWLAQTWRQSSAHRAARQLIERDQIGAVSAISLRLPHAFEPSVEHDASRFAATLSSLDLLRHFAEIAAPTSSTRSSNFPAGAMAFENSGATQIGLRYHNGVVANALFAGAESWSAPLPRLEIVGTQGRSIVCESARRLWLHHPREAARFWEPPGMSHQVSSANVSGVAEDLKEFLAWCVEERTSSTRSNAINGVARDDVARVGELRVGDSQMSELRDGEIAWRWLETVNASLISGAFEFFLPTRHANATNATSLHTNALNANALNANALDANANESNAPEKTDIAREIPPSPLTLPL